MVQIYNSSETVTAWKTSHYKNEYIYIFIYKRRPALNRLEALMRKQKFEPA